MDDASREYLDAATARAECPNCREKALRVEWRLQAREVGTFSLAGSQMKFSASEAPFVVCTACGIEGTINRVDEGDADLP